MKEEQFVWRQEKNRAIVKYPKGEIYFDMPEGWKLSETHKDLIMLANHALFSPFYEVPIYEHKFTRKPGKKIGLAFSGGVDSTAAMLLLEGIDIELIYHERGGFKKTCMKQDNALYLFKKMKQKVWKVKSNNEIIGERENGKRGFSTDYCAGIGVILMADFLDLGYFASGQMMESTHLRRGYRFRDFDNCKFWRLFQPIFRLAGLPILGPVFSCSEVVTNEIVNKSEFANLSQSCVRGIDGKECNQCYKCFRKILIRGEIPGRSFEVNYVLNQRPLKQAASLIYAMNKFNVEILELSEYDTMELKFVERYYSPALNLLPEGIKKVVEGNLSKYGIDPMTKEEMAEMRTFDISK